MQHGPGHVLFHHALGDAQFRRDLPVAQAIQPREQKGPPHLERQGIQHGVNRQQGVQDDLLLFRRDGQRLGPGGERAQAGLFNLAPPPVVNQQAPRHLH